MNKHQKVVELATALHEGTLNEKKLNKETAKYLEETGDYINTEYVKNYAKYTLPELKKLDEALEDENDEFFLPETDPYEFFGLKK